MRPFSEEALKKEGWFPGRGKARYPPSYYAGATAQPVSFDKVIDIRIIAERIIVAPARRWKHASSHR
jgi:hypothetical protein